MTATAGTWAASGLARLTSRPGGPALEGPGTILAVAEAWAARLSTTATALGGRDPVPAAGAAALLVQRAAHRAPAAQEPPEEEAGSCRLLAAADGTVAVNLPRPDDADLLPAWLGLPPGPDHAPVDWEAVASAIGRRPVAEVVDGGAALGLAVAAVAAGDDVDEQLVARGAADRRLVPLLGRIGPAGAVRAPAELLVVDLSSLWAGPLCARLLGDAGARVVKVESTERPDGARRGPPSFYEMLHGGDEAVAVPFSTDAGRRALRALLARADVVIEGSRPRALDQLGIRPADSASAHPGQVWVAVTAYGRTGPWRDRVGFGDDAAAAGGLVVWDDEGPVLCGDALADPLAGVGAAAATLDAVAAGGGLLVDAALREAARAAAPTGRVAARPASGPLGEPTRLAGRRGAAPGHGADTRRVLLELGLPAELVDEVAPS